MMNRWRKKKIEKENMEKISLLVKLKFTIELDVISFYPTGSRYICDPPVNDTDDDWIILVSDLDKAMDKISDRPEWDACHLYLELEKNNAGIQWMAYRRLSDNTNIIITDSKEEYAKFCAATELAKKMNLTDKKDRIQLFNLIRNGTDDKEKYSGPLPLI